MANKSLDTIKSSIAGYWNGRAFQYDQNFGHGLFDSDEKRAWLMALADHVHCPKGSKILDLGCGTGFLSLLLAELGYQVTGIDFSEEMMAEARRKAVLSGLKINFLEGDAEYPPVEPGTFQAVVSRHLLWTLPDPARAVSNWMETLSPGGQVLVIDGVWTPRTMYARMRFWLSAGVNFLKKKPTHRNWEQEYLPNPEELPFMGGAEPEKVVELFKNAGLKQIWRDDLKEVLRSEKKIAPLEYRLAFTMKNSRYLVGGYK